MRKIFYSLTSLFILASSEVMASAMEYHNIEIGGSIYDYSYNEPGVMEQEGYMYGLDGAVTFKSKDFTSEYTKKDLLSELFLRGELSLSLGQVDYQSKNTGSIDGEDNSRFEGRLLIGKSNLFISGLNPYLGVGYRKLVNDAEGMVSTTGHYGYERTSRYVYIPVGIGFDVIKKKKLKIEAKAEYDFFVRGTQTSDLRYLGSYKSEKDQNSGYGLRGSVRFIIPHNNKREFIIEPFANYWNIDDSDPDQYGLLYEPKNDTMEIGLKFSVSMF